MKPSDKEQQLQRENTQLKEQVEGLKKRLEELEGQKKPSKTRQQAEKALEMLKAGPVSVEQLKTLNEKYPTDPIYYVRTALKVDVKTVRTAAGSVYMLPDQHAIYLEGQKKEKEAAEQAQAASKEEQERPSRTPGAPENQAQALQVAA